LTHSACAAARADGYVLDRLSSPSSPNSVLASPEFKKLTAGEAERIQAVIVIDTQV